MTYSIKEQVTEDFKKVKQQGGDRAQRIKQIMKTAVTEAWTEAKDGTQEVKSTSKASLSNAVQSFLTVDQIAAEQVLTVRVVEDEATAGGNPEQPSVEDAATDDEPAAKANLAPALLRAAGLRAQAFLEQQYDKLPDRYDQFKQQATAWDEQLGERYGDDYERLKQRYTKVADWYQSKWSEGQKLKPNAVERKQTVVVEELSDLGTTIAQKEAVMKEKMGQVLRTITVNAES